MKTKHLGHFALFLVLTFYVLAHSQGNLGQSGGNFLQITAEPRGAALGGAGVAVISGAAALYYNPAGAISTKNMSINLSYTDWFIDTKLAYGAIVKNLVKIGTIGISVTSFYMDDMEITTVYESEGTGEYFSAGDLVAGVSYARALTDRFTFGVTGKYIRENIWNETADQFAFDVGSLYQTDFFGLRLGIAIRNISGKLKFEGNDIEQKIQDELNQNIPDNPRVERLSPEFRVPQIFQIGIAFDPIKTDSWALTVISDVETPNDNNERFILGLEYSFRSFAYLRGAYRIKYDLGELSFGAGLHLPLSGVQTNLDYSFSNYGILGDVHRIGFGISL